MTWDEMKQIQVREYNHPAGGSSCTMCHGRGWMLVPWNEERFHHVMVPCPVCGDKRQQDDAARKAGNAPRYGDYIDLNDWQRDLHLKACAFAQHPEGVFYIGGQTATGKSHLCSKIYYHFMANDCNGLNFQPLKAFSRRSSKDWQLIETAKGCNILWLDGFLDIVNIGKGTPSAADLDRALEVIDARCSNGRITIISSCWTPERLEDIAPPIASRIELATGEGRYFLAVPDGKQNRWKHPA